jgi:hypothetical protein
MKYINNTIIALNIKTNLKINEKLRPKDKGIANNSNVLLSVYSSMPMPPELDGTINIRFDKLIMSINIRIGKVKPKDNAIK